MREREPCVPEENMLEIAALRTRQERKAASALHALTSAKQALRNAISAAEAREREYREITESVRLNLEALDTVEGLLREESSDVPHEDDDRTVEGLSRLMIATAAPATEPVARVVRTSSRPLFSSFRRSKAAELSILP